jgi:hypothetical protein
VLRGCRVKGAGCGGRVSVVRAAAKLTTTAGRSVRRIRHGIIYIPGRLVRTIMGLLPREGKFFDLFISALAWRLARHVL